MPANITYPKRVWLLIIIASVVRLVFAASTGLSADEVYYWSFALKPQWSYFDHPPMVAWLIRITTINMLAHSEVFVRLGAVVCSAICTWLVFKIAAYIANEKAGWLAALLYTACIYSGVTIGTSILPDSPEMVFWFLGLFMLIKISRLSPENSKANVLWGFFGLVAGLSILCKEHGAFLWFGAFLYVVLTDRAWLKSKSVYMAVIITIIVVSPVMVWNIQHNFIGYKFHSSRITFENGIHIWYFFKALLSEIAIVNPIVFYLIIFSLVLALQGKLSAERKEIKIILFCSIPLIVSVLIISIFHEIFAHWPGPGYASLLILPAIRLGTIVKGTKVPGIIKGAIVYMIVIALSQTLIVNYLPGTLSAQKDGLKTGADDLSVDMFGWQSAGKAIDSLYKQDVTNNLMPKNSPLIATNWDTAALLQFYVADKTNQEVLGIGGILDLHQYYLSNLNEKLLKPGDSAYMIVPSNTFYYKTTNEVFRRFKLNQLAQSIPQYRSGVICKYVYVYRLMGYIK
jgi:4-amino-4-deoxy-L-arabinose transferase-like glycosyltransferase